MEPAELTFELLDDPFSPPSEAGAQSLKVIAGPRLLVWLASRSPRVSVWSTFTRNKSEGW
jgi:hypothetical protein